jgi:L-threonylcarbamoyladenylate synthase
MPSPGVGLKHYAPKARLVLVEGGLAELGARLSEAARAWQNERVGVMLPAEVDLGFAAAVFSWGRWYAPEEMAHTLYAGLRALDGQGCTVILCPMPPPEGIGAAIRDRLMKAGSGDRVSATGDHDH